MNSDLGAFAVCIALVFCAAVGFIFGTRYERDTHDEWQRASDCPKDTWKYSWCVPTGCSVDLATYPPSWDCGSRTFQQMEGR